MSSFLSYEQKKVVLNSFISEQFNSCPLIWMFISIRSYRKISKLHNRSLQLCHNDYTSTYDELFSKHGLQYSHKKYSVINDWDFQTYKRSISLIMIRYLCWEISLIPSETQGILIFSCKNCVLWTWNYGKKINFFINIIYFIVDVN